MSEKYTYTSIPPIYTTTVYTHYCISSWSAGEIRTYDCDMTGETYILLAQTDLSVKIPAQKDIKETVIKALEEEKKKQMADHHKKLCEIQEKIDSLLCLEYKPASEVEDDIIPF